jgi:hypothetical protein
VHQARQIFNKLGIGPGNSLLGGIAVCFMALPFVFYKVSKRSKVGSNLLAYFCAVWEENASVEQKC